MDELLKFAQRVAKIPKKGLTRIQFFEDESNLSSFEKFLLDARIRNFLLLAVISSMDKEFVVIKEQNYEYLYGEDEEEETTDLGLGIFDKICSSDEVFAHLLSNLGLGQIISTPIQARYITQREPKFRLDHFSSSGETIISTDGTFIYRNGDFYLGNPAEIKLPFELFYKKAEELFSIAQNKVSVSHEIYVKWLLALFPGKIKVRMLP